MKKRIAISMFVVLLVTAAMGGATMAWFTDQAEIEQNVFEAGTVELDATDNFDAATANSTLENWNPGDCSDKEITIEYTGSKNAFLRMQITEEWSGITGDSDDENGEYYERNAPNVTWEGWDDENWLYYEEWWYYTGGSGEHTITINEEEINSLDPGEDDVGPFTIVTRVCLDGEETGNDFQGATYTIDATFQAIQGSYSDEWNWDDVIEQNHPDED